MPKRKNKSKESNYVYIYRILTQHCYTFRSSSHYGKLLKETVFKEASIFLNEIRNTRINNGFSDHIIGNMYENKFS